MPRGRAWMPFRSSSGTSGQGPPPRHAAPHRAPIPGLRTVGLAPGHLRRRPPVAGAVEEVDLNVNVNGHNGYLSCQTRTSAHRRSEIIRRADQREIGVCGCPPG